jgi:hypothetical protein
LAVIVTPNISTHKFVEASGSWLDDVNMVEFEDRIAHGSSLVCEIVQVDRLAGGPCPLQ